MIHNTDWRCSPTPILQEGATETSQPSAAVLDDFKGVQPWEEFGKKAEVKTRGCSSSKEICLPATYQRQAVRFSVKPPSQESVWLAGGKFN